MTAYSEDDLPIVSRFFPAPGVVVDRVERKVRIRAWLELSGPEATLAKAVTVRDTINTKWTFAFKNGREVSCNATVGYRGPGTTAGYGVQIVAKQMLDASQTVWE